MLDELKPDIVLCLHFNAEGWGDPLQPQLVPNNHFHLILNGAYMDQEVALEMMEDDAGWQLSAYEPWEINLTMKQKKIVHLLQARSPEFVPGKEIAELLGMKHPNVRQILHRMAEDGMVESEGRGGAGFRAKPAGP